MQRNVGRVGSLLATTLACLALTGCAETHEPSAERDAVDGWQRGELAVYTADSVDGHSVTTYYLRDTTAGAVFAETKLLFDREPPPELVTGVRVRVRGVDGPDGLRVTNYETLRADADGVTSALIGATPYAPRSFAMVLINLNGLGVNTTADSVMGRLIGNADSIRNYYLADSYGQQDITAQVFGPINYTMATCSNSDASKLSRDLIPMISGTFQHYLWYIGATNANGSPCTWGGLGSVGNPQAPAKDTWYNGSSSCVVLVQEPGHNFGMQHSSTLACGTGAAFMDDPNGCTYSEYGDRFDPMGGGCRHMNAWQKQYQGWFGGCNGVRVARSGTFTLLPFEPQCNGVQFLMIKMPKARPFNRPAGGGGNAGVDTLGWYYLELRTPVDFDGTLGNTSTLTPRVLVHVGADPRTRTQTGLHTYLLDMNPWTTGSSGLNDAGLAMGQTFNDPAGGMSFTTTALSATSATITVTFADDSGAAPTCLDNSAFTAPGPVDCTMGGGTGGTTGGAGTGGGMAGRGGAGGSGGSTGTAGSSGGAAGRGGAGGAAGTAGRGGNGGAAGSAGTAGRGGNGGSTGAGGTAGVAGNGGTAGVGGGTAGTGTPGSGGTTAGSAGTTGAAGTGVTGTAGAAGGTAGDDGAAGTTGTTGAAGNGMVTGAAGASPNPSGYGGKYPGEVTGGISCAAAGGGPPSPLAAMLALAAMLVGRARPLRRRRNRHQRDLDRQEV